MQLEINVTIRFNTNGVSNLSGGKLCPNNMKCLIVVVDADSNSMQVVVQKSIWQLEMPAENWHNNKSDQFTAMHLFQLILAGISGVECRKSTIRKKIAKAESLMKSFRAFKAQRCPPPCPPHYCFWMSIEMTCGPIKLFNFIIFSRFLFFYIYWIYFGVQCTFFVDNSF